MGKETESPVAENDQGTTAEQAGVQAGIDTLGDEAPATVEDTETPTTETPVVEEEPKSTGLSKDDITEILGKVMENKPTAAAPEAVQPQMTQEQLEKMFDYWNPDDAFVAKLLAADKPQDVKAALKEMRDGLQKQMAKVTAYWHGEQMKKLREEDLAPLREYVEERRVMDFRNDFFKAHPDLEPYEQIVDMVAAKASQSGFQGKTRKDVMTHYATEAQKVINQLLASKGQAGLPIQAPAKKPSKMSTLTGGGQTGGTRATPTRKYDHLSKGMADGVSLFD